MEKPRCAYTGAVINDPGDAIYDDGEWLSWDWINSQIDAGDDSWAVDDEGDLAEDGRPRSVLALSEVFYDLVEVARRHWELTGRHLEIWGELGELYAEIRHDLRRHPKHQAGSDGTIDGQLVEVKTISPEKRSARVLVKRSGDFQRLLIVRISPNLTFASRLIDRSELHEGTGALIRARWAEPCDGVSDP